MIELKPALQTTGARSPVWAGARLVNCFAERADGDKRSDFALLAAPGLTRWTNLGTGPYRGGLRVGGVPYVVSGNSIYWLEANGSAHNVGAIPGDGPVRMATNGRELAIATNVGGYVVSGGDVHTPLAFSATDVCYFDGYFVWVAGQQFFISALDDGLTYDATDIATVEGAPDTVIGMVNDHRELQFYGSETIEIFYNSGNFDFPFQRQGNAFVERGCFDRDSIVKLDNSVTFVGNDRIVYTLNGYQPQRISTHWVEYMLRDTTYARAWTYTLEGHKFYVLECSNGTCVFDHATGAWHQRASHLSDFWRCAGGFEAYGKLIFGDRENGDLYIASNDVHDEAGDPLRFEIELPTIDGKGERLTMYAFELVCETGVGTLETADPQAVLTYSDNGGRAWSLEMWRSLGGVGDYRRRAIWRSLGQFRTRVMRIRITDAVRRLVLSYRADIR